MRWRSQRLRLHPSRKIRKIVDRGAIMRSEATICNMSAASLHLAMPAAYCLAQ
jgi:hypothetical protein